MISAFGVQHGYISKAREYQRDPQGRFAAARAKGKKDVEKHGRLTDEEFDEQLDWYHPDYKSLHMLAEKDPKEWRKKREEMEEDAHYWQGRNEPDLADDIRIAIDTSDEIYAKHHKKVKT